MKQSIFEKKETVLLRFYPAFLSLEKFRSFDKASQELGLSESGLRAQIDLLEKEINTPLFVKLHNNLLITEMGRQLAQECKNYVYEKNLSLKKVSFLPKKITVQLTLTTERLYGADIVEILLQAFPDYSICIKLSEGLPDFSNGEIDMALNYFHAGHNPDIESFVLTRFKLFMYASEDYLKKAPPLDHASDLGRHILVGYQGLQNAVLDLNWFTRLNQPQIIPLNITTNSTFSVVSMIEGGAGIGSFASHVLKFSKSKLTHVLPQHEGNGHTLYWMYNRALIDPEKMNSIIGPLRKLFN
jgi:DNA-binding transcriptional LysR family regulator